MPLKKISLFGQHYSLWVHTPRNLSQKLYTWTNEKKIKSLEFPCELIIWNALTHKTPTTSGTYKNVFIYLNICGQNKNQNKNTPRSRSILSWEYIFDKCRIWLMKQGYRYILEWSIGLLRDAGDNLVLTCEMR